MHSFHSAIIDCVGCEKCRLWGKLQVLGMGTALKILFSVDGSNDINQSVSDRCGVTSSIIIILIKLETKYPVFIFIFFSSKIVIVINLLF